MTTTPDSASAPLPGPLERLLEAMDGLLNAASHPNLAVPAKACSAPTPTIDCVCPNCRLRRGMRVLREAAADAYLARSRFSYDQAIAAWETVKPVPLELRVELRSPTGGVLRTVGLPSDFLFAAPQPQTECALDEHGIEPCR